MEFKQKMKIYPSLMEYKRQIDGYRKRFAAHSSLFPHILQSYQNQGPMENQYYKYIKRMNQEQFKVCHMIQVPTGKIPVCFANYITADVIEKVLKSYKFLQYLNKMSIDLFHHHCFKRVEVMEVDLFTTGNIGFIELRVYRQQGETCEPKYVFLRGDSVTILLLVNGKIAMVEQYRVPIQKSTLEAPSGMLDEDGDLVGKAATQIFQETGIKVRKQNLTPLGSYLPCPGCSDEQIFMFFCQANIPEDKMTELENKLHGEEKSQERIKLRFIKHDLKTIMETNDSALFALLYAYNNRDKIQS